MLAQPSLAEPTLAKPSLTLKRRLKASPATVYRAWTDPEKLALWWGSEHSEVVSASLDARLGGRYRIVFRTPDGETHDVSGVYLEVVPDEKLVFTWAWRSTPERESLVTIDLKRDGDATVLTLTHEQFFDETARDNHGRGWTIGLDSLERMAPDL